jgi:hypothetical protein
MSGYAEWEVQFKAQIDGRIALNSKILLEATKEFLRRVQERTPVGNPGLWKYPAPKNYRPGTLKASWSVSYSPITTSGVYATISNNEPYAYRVEFGWSTQAPNGMLRVTILEWPDIVKQKNEGI